MIRTIINHNIVTGHARIRFEHNDVTTEHDFSLIDILPGSRYILNEMGIDFTEELQNVAIEKLTAMIQTQIEHGLVVNPPIPEPVGQTPPEGEPE